MFEKGSFYRSLLQVSFHICHSWHLCHVVKSACGSTYWHVWTETCKKDNEICFFYRSLFIHVTPDIFVTSWSQFVYLHIYMYEQKPAKEIEKPVSFETYKSKRLSSMKRNPIKDIVMYENKLRKRSIFVKRDLQTRPIRICWCVDPKTDFTTWNKCQERYIRKETCKRDI